MSTNGGSAAPPCGRNSRNAIWGGGALPPHTWGPPSLAIIDPGLGSIIDSPAVECWLPAGRRCLWCVGVFFCGFLRIFFSGTLWGRKVRRSRPAAARRPMVSHASPLRRRDRARACHAGGGGGGGEGGGWGAPMPEGWRRGGPRAPGRGRARAAPLRGRRGARRIGTRRADDRNARQKKKKGAVLSSPERGRRPRHAYARTNTRRSLRCAVPRGELRRAAGFWPASRPTSPPRLAGAGTRGAGCRGEMLMLKASDSAECGPNLKKSVHFDYDGDMYPEMEGAKFTHLGRKVVVTRS